MARIHINIGSNTGDRAALIERAVVALAGRLDPMNEALIRLSAIIETDPWGFKSPNKFFNLGVMIDTRETVDPENILAVLQSVEHEISDAPHRKADGSYSDRLIDIDLIAVDALTVSTPSLTLPHPRLQERRFVLEPLAELDPEWRHPVIGKTAREMLESEKLADNVE